MKNEIRFQGRIVWIKLTQGKETCIDINDLPEVAQYRWTASKGRQTWYARTAVSAGGLQVYRYLHRFLLQATQVDHRDRNGLNNTRRNLRAANHFQNAQNCGKRGHNTSGFKGVSFHKRSGKWQASIMLCREQKYLGLFKTPAEASLAYDTASLLLHSDFSSLNK